MIVDTVSPTPFSLLRRVKNFEYRASDHDLQEFSQYEDPVQALTDECRRVLRSISSSNQSNVSRASESTGLKDASWSRFQDIGFGAPIEEGDSENGSPLPTLSTRNRQAPTLRRTPGSETNDLGRPTTPSWADFLSTGFVDEQGQKAPSSLLLPPDKVLPPIVTINQRGHSSQSHRRNLESEPDLEPGELASITKLDLDDSFWWVWISSLSGEEPVARKAVFGRCALLETIIPGGKWLVMEEQVKGAIAAQPPPGAYIAEKKGFFSFASRKGKVNRRKSAIKKSDQPYPASQTAPTSRVNIGPDQHARIQAAAAALQQKQRDQHELQQSPEPGVRRGRNDVDAGSKTTSVMTLQPVIMKEASPAMKWASQYDKQAIRAKYLGDRFAGKGASTELLTLPEGGLNTNGSAISLNSGERSPKPPPKDEPAPQSKRPVTPPPPPPEVTVEARPANEEAQQAAEVPLPAEKPAPETPAKNPEPVAAPVAVSKTSPDQKEPKKLQKKKQPGLKGIFGNKKAQSQPKPAKAPAESKSAIAAARAALEGQTSPTAQSNLSPTEPAPKSNRFGTRPTHRAAQVNERPPSPAKEEEKTPTAEQFTASHPETRRDEEYDQLSRVDTDEREQADREFSKFDQGPLADQPAFVPQESPAFEQALSPVEHTISEDPVSHPPIPGALVEEDESAELPDIPRQRQNSPPDASAIQVQDRWAQIRKNAAERAARQSEEQSRVTDRTDDGETSGEESE